MPNDFDVEWFSQIIAEKLKEGYPIKMAVILAMLRFPPMVEAIIEGIKKGGLDEV